MTEQARIYGTVLFELDIPQEMVEQAATLLRENPPLQEVLSSPVVKREKKHRILGKIFREPEYTPLLLHFLMKATDAGCIGQLPGIVFVCQELQHKSRGIAEASLRYVTMPDASWIERIRKFLMKKYGYQDVTFQFTMDPSLIGGFILKVGDVEYDYSLRRKLLKLRQTVVR